ncbi:MAG: toprim domain-containing protein [Bacteroidetes bacterium]|nr:toprim domain-containing protein [Bacteroidota bacterium]
MDIPDLKQRLPIQTILNHYNLSVAKNNMLCCPFHEDRTPSLQIYPKTNTYHCFGCGATGDVIQFIQDYEKIGKHQAILKAKTLCNGHIITNHTTPLTMKDTNVLTKVPPAGQSQVEQLSRQAVLQKAWAYFHQAGRSNSRALRDYLLSRNLDPAKLEIGYNSAQFHHRQSRQLVESYAKYNLLLPGRAKSHNGQGYMPWAKYCIMFPLKDKAGKVVSMYGRSIVAKPEAETGKHFYMKDRQGLYPGYPKPETQRLIIAESVIDTATLLQLPEIADNYTLLAAYGTNGITQEHKQAIIELKELKEIILFFDGDQAAHDAVSGYEKDGKHYPGYAESFHSLRPDVSISMVNTPDNEDVNSLHQAYESAAYFTELLNGRTFLFSVEKKKEQQGIDAGRSGDRTEPGKNLSLEGVSNPDAVKTATQETKVVPGNGGSLSTGKLDTSNPENIRYLTDELEFALLGGIGIRQLDRMRVTLRTGRIPQLSPLHSIRQNLDLYNDEQVERYIRKAAERLEMGTAQLMQPVYCMIEQLEKYRFTRRTEQKQNMCKPKIEVNHADKQAALDALKRPDLLSFIRQSLAQTGLVGEENNGLLLFLIFLTRRFDHPLHAIVHGTSGSGKTHLLKSVLHLVPPESVYTTTALTENVLFYPPYKEFWKHKILLLEDLDGSYAALLPLREFMSNQYISKLSTEHDPKTGEFKQRFLEAEGPIVIAGATTRDRLYEDNANRSFILHVNESGKHRDQVMDYQNRQAAGLIDKKSINELVNLVRNMQRLLEPVKIINPYAPELKLPDYVFKPLRTNAHYLTLIKAITYLHQYRLPKKRDKEGTEYIETTLDHIAIANELSKELLLRKSDELSGGLRIFFENLKSIIKKDGQQPEQTGFYAKDIRQKLRLNPMRVNRYLRDLEMRSYIQRTGGNKKKALNTRLAVGTITKN